MKYLTLLSMLLTGMSSLAQIGTEELIKLQRNIHKMNWAETELMANPEVREMRKKVQYERKQLLKEVSSSDKQLKTMLEDCNKVWEALQNDSSNGKKQGIYLTKCLEINAYLMIHVRDNKDFNQPYKTWSDLAKKLEDSQYNLYKLLDTKKAQKFKGFTGELQKNRSKTSSQFI
jgi:hypothetical protein